MMKKSYICIERLIWLIYLEHDMRNWRQVLANIFLLAANLAKFPLYIKKNVKSEKSKTQLS